MANDYKKTMKLPKTKFPMRAGLANSEPKRLQKWYDADVYNLMLNKNEGHPSFILHDGPPYANGPIHIGHAMNKIAKDIILKYKSMQGFYSPFVPGWDCHGQPIEHKIETKLGAQKFKSLPQEVIRRLCREYALENVEIQKAGFKRLGVLGKWDDPYLTLNHDYEVGDVEIFKRIYMEGAIYRGRKPIHWCKQDHTALAEAEIEYSDEISPSIYVTFDLTKTPEFISGIDVKPSIAIWTTTPWTLPANAAVALAADADYVAVIRDGKAMIMAEALVPAVSEAAGWEDVQLYSVDNEIARVKGKDLEGCKYIHPIFDDLECPIIVGDHVGLSDGTGAVHTAPGHGQEDYEVGLLYNLPMPMPVDDNGAFTEAGGPFAGMDIDEANPVIIDWIDKRGALIVRKDITHSYPHCWRCKNPVIFRATDQWFVSMEKTGLREKALDEIKKVTWYPDYAINRIGAMVEDRPDWCISRQRSWGIPIPVFKCAKCGETVATEESFNAVEALFKEHGSDAWFTTDPKEYMPESVCCPNCGSHDLIPEKDILDVWWESGVSHTSVLDNYPELRRPADMYLEGSDQHRGWFQSSLLTSVAAYGYAPYKSVVSQGFAVDENGRKMSKSVGNVIDPNEICGKQGAEIVRLWVSSTDTSSDVAVSQSILDRTSDAYRRFRNTYRFLLSNIMDFDVSSNTVEYDELETIDKWALARLAQVHQAVSEGYEGYRFHSVYRALYDYVVSDLSSVYLDAIKDRLYADATDSPARRGAQTVCVQILSMLVKDMQPILSFTTDEVLEYAPEGLFDQEYAALLDWYQPVVSMNDSAAELESYTTALEIRDVVTKSLEDARNEKVVGKSQEAIITITAPASKIQAISSANLEEFFIVAQVKFVEGEEISCGVEAASGEKCARCWNIRELGVDANHPDICSRCAQVVAAVEAQQESQESGE